MNALQEPGLILARTLHFWALAVMLGGAGFVALLRRELGPWPRRVLRGAAVLAALSGIAWFTGVFVDVTGDRAALLDPDQWSAFMTSAFGPPWAIQLGLSGVALGLVAATRPAPVLAVGVLLALDQAWLGHAATATGGAAVLAIASYWLHVLAGLAWVGALVMLCVVGVAERRVPRDGLGLFSDLGIVLVATVLASGIVNASLRLRTLADLAATTYGHVLGVKVALFAGMIALAVVNRREGRLADGRGSLALTVALETGCGLAVLGVAAVLGITSPPG